jgi:glycerophosphoryl diester phosphodiesterase
MDMEFLAHRGHWQERRDANTPGAFARAWSGGFGIETDLRDRDGGVVISHDPPVAAAMTLEALFGDYAAKGGQTTLALNIKSDGLQRAIMDAVARHRIKNYFVFDMSVPDSLHFLRAGQPVFVRLSEYEAESPLLDRAAGVWLDAFEEEWWTLDTIRSLTGRGKSVAIVSPELHGRAHAQLWHRLRDLEPAASARVLLCTDFPDAASKVFSG